MAIIPQPSLFSWKEVEATDDLTRFARVRDVLPDEPLMRTLEAERKGKHDEYPLRAVWNGLIASVIFGHESIASFLRELGRNGELRDACGFHSMHAETAVPGEHVYSRFFSKLLRHLPLVEQMFDEMVEQALSVLPGFGRDLAVDGKAIHTRGRNDPDASLGVKTYDEEEEGTAYQKLKKWFGYKLHLVVDANYELPVAWELTGAAVGESPRLMPLIESLERKHPTLLEQTETLAADRGYDDGSDKQTLHDIYGIAPLMDSRDLHGGKMQPLDPAHHDTIYYSPTGDVCCRVDPFEPDDHKAFASMQFMGFEKDRQTLKFRCPAAAFGLECRNSEACRCRLWVREGDYGRVVRVPLARDRRVFMPIHRHSQTFEKAYRKRTAIERVNSRIDQVYGFERHFIRGKKKMQLRVGLALIVMLATAVAWVKASKPQRIRSLVLAA
jgi:hypothetical protein